MIVHQTYVCEAHHPYYLFLMFDLAYAFHWVIRDLRICRQMLNETRRRPMKQAS